MFTRQSSLLLPQLAQNRLKARGVELKLPDQWDKWLNQLFPNLFYHSFTDRHAQFWQHVESIKAGVKPPAFFAVWPRGGGKSTNAEAAVVRLGALEKKRFCLYVRSIQDKANESVSNIGAMLENSNFAKNYSQMSERKLGRYGNSKGWKVNLLRCNNGFSVAALGFDAAVRGIKIEEFRPDLIIIDDIDDKSDSWELINKKVQTLTRDILPAGSTDCAVIGIQNLIHYNGIFTQLVNDKADFLKDRIISGPYPAIEDFEYDTDVDGKYIITAGRATWEGQNLETCQAQMNEWGISAFIEEAQHLILKKTGRVYHKFTDNGPNSKELDYSQVEGYYHSHDFGAVNHVWGLWAKIGKTYYLIFEQKLPEGTSAGRAEIVKAKFGDKKVIAGWGGAKSEKQQRIDFAVAGLRIRQPAIAAVDSQVNAANDMFDKGELVICSDCLGTIDDLLNQVRNDKEEIADESKYHYAAMVRYFAAGIKYKGGTW